MTDIDALTKALQEDFAEKMADLIYQRLKAEGMPQKLLLTEEEAAWALGFTESAMHQSDWRDEIPVTKIGIKNRYHVDDLETFAKNHRIERLRKINAA